MVCYQFLIKKKQFIGNPKKYYRKFSLMLIQLDNLSNSVILLSWNTVQLFRCPFYSPKPILVVHLYLSTYLSSHFVHPGSGEKVQHGTECNRYGWRCRSREYCDPLDRIKFDCDNNTVCCNDVNVSSAKPTKAEPESWHSGMTSSIEGNGTREFFDKLYF